MENYIPELKNSIKTSKLGQAKSLLETLDQRHPEDKEQVLQMLALASDKNAFELLTFLTSEKYRTSELYPRLVQLVIDRAHLNFNFAHILLKNTDRSILDSAAPLLKHILTNETDKEILNAIIRSAGKVPITSLAEEIAEFIFYDDLELKQEAVKALERMGTATAFEKLVLASKTEKCDQDILDAVDMLKNRYQPEPVIEAEPEPKPPKAKKPAPEKQKAKQVTQTEPVQENDLLEGLSSTDIEQRLDTLISFSGGGSFVADALAEALKGMDHDRLISLLLLTARNIPLEAVNDLFDIIVQKDFDNNIKFAAYLALGAYPELESAAAVVQGLSESSVFVRMAAIQVLDRNMSDYVCAEIKNKIESGTKKGEALAQEILDSRAKNLIEYLMISDTFSYMASNHLSKNAPLSAMDTFINILEERKLKSTARKYADMKARKEVQERKLVVVVSPFEAILNLYSRLIYAAGGSALTFLNPQQAFESIVSLQPDAILADLFLEDMTGFDFCNEVRELYSAEQMPLMISSLHKELDKKWLEDKMKTAQVAGFCDFPAKTSQIKSWIK